MTDMSGLWEGRYLYPGGGPAVDFDAEIGDKSGALSGVITEPNTFDLNAGPLLTSVLAGQVNGGSVAFTKTYVGEGNAQHSVRYAGTLLDDKTRITGSWKIGFFTGPFEMTRLSGRESRVKDTEEKRELSS